MIMPVAAAFAVSAITFLLAGQGWARADLRAMVAPLVTFLLGAARTMAVVELSAAGMITGASRLVAGTLRLLLLGFGIVGAAQVVGLPWADALVDTPANQLGWWAPWVGVLLVGIGNYLYLSAPGGSLGWLLLVLYAAWIGQNLGDQALGGYLSGFVGAIVMTPAPTSWTATFGTTRPGVLPAFWVLVPGALGLIGEPSISVRTPSQEYRTSSVPSARWWPSALASSAAIRSTARWHGPRLASGTRIRLRAGPMAHRFCWERPGARGVARPRGCFRAWPHGPSGGRTGRHSGRHRARR